MTLTDLPARWRGATVLVVGDAMLDGWLAGSPRRLCREAPAPVLEVERITYAGGGAANTAANIAALGGRAMLVSPIGEDPDGGRLRRRLDAAGVDHRLVPVRGRRTLAKRRLVADEQIVLRFDEGDTGALPAKSEAALVDVAATALDSGVDAVVVGDYGGGGAAESVRALLAQRRDDIPLLVVDAHDPRPWAGVRPDLVTPSFAEACRLLECDPVAVGTRRAEWVIEATDRLLALAGAPTVAVTLDIDGSVVLTAEVEPVRTHALPAPTSLTVGAGDAYVAAFTLALAAKVPLADAAHVAQLAATAATRGHVPGTAVCDTHGLLEIGGEGDQVEIGAADLVAAVAAYRKRGKRIVFTNGCFDVLHRGHVGYLNQARRLGDVLIVAVNSDDSVRRLKGPERPVNSVEDRVAVLAALSSVDHVVVFEEDTPANLIALVRPDLYVKGGDYRPEMIPEASLVRELGGEVLTLDYLPDRSTTKLIGRIRAGTARSAAHSAKQAHPQQGHPQQGHPLDPARGRRTRS
ncbi:D-glycero-beta-D-manno-heptose 1-phosphate adenylyltransferase [Planosporangium flavigriseum]|uniref:D-glycero-beta-D-manno-heptose 1-phosphate adenylyltransferase n=1 Tax=Planosporangium flavigriseum TaxID=373681 RepID=A0A8J3LNZ2_9ACTN|nr:D-glycero-beta-D-manno-heptose 1-phosphate adenylyltransferase [Planosporangium flavigriseum]NJC66399.1 D-glycero-beta-D-manno-heptose 1-phosphate adenylyltransferase [Planosporangium flavigriseum]GIG74195.1 bifunctional protein HldE [Planosporangium flavigriseum]